MRGGEGGCEAQCNGTSRPTSCTFVSLSPLHTFWSMLGVGATVCNKGRGRGRAGQWVWPSPFS